MHASDNLRADGVTAPDVGDALLARLRVLEEREEDRRRTVAVLAALCRDGVGKKVDVLARDGVQLALHSQGAALLGEPVVDAVLVEADLQSVSRCGVRVVVVHGWLDGCFHISASASASVAGPLRDAVASHIRRLLVTSTPTSAALGSSHVALAVARPVQHDEAAVHAHEPPTVEGRRPGVWVRLA